MLAYATIQLALFRIENFLRGQSRNFLLIKKLFCRHIYCSYPVVKPKSRDCARFRTHIVCANAHSCVLTLAASLGLRPNPPKALPLETAKGFAFRIHQRKASFGIQNMLPAHKILRIFWRKKKLCFLLDSRGELAARNQKRAQTHQRALPFGNPPKESFLWNPKYVACLKNSTNFPAENK